MAQLSQLQALKAQFVAQPTVKGQKERLDVITTAVKYASEQAIAVGRDLLQVRLFDVQL